ncbi:MAG: hypothetical protein IK075_05690 [Prevotella sp.]|nr:hypothetical protein [Prevotella sp.]
MLSFVLLGVSISASGQVHVSGSVQSDVLLPQKDDRIGAEEYDEFALTNTYADVSLMSKYIDAGARMEFMQYPLPGFEKNFKGWGVPHAYVKGHFEKLEVTAGTFYDQFGSGFIFRTYEERSLGIDNALLGGRVVYKPTAQITIKALTGKQRQYWSLADSWISGADAEWNISDLTFGASFVNKHEGQEVIMTDVTHKLNLPENVNAFDLRVQLQRKGLGLMAEYAWKSQDPSFDNGYIFRKGYVAMLSASYSKRGSSILIQAKRSDNMSFRSERSVTGTSSFINHQPAFTTEHTYTLPSLYPYATNPWGEWAYQIETAHTFQKKTALGGRYGTTVKVNFSHIHDIDHHWKYINGSFAGSDGYGSTFWKWGDRMFYQEWNVQVDKKMSKSLKMNLMYMNQFYNKTVVEGEGGIIHSDILVVEGKYSFNKKVTLRAEAQYLFTKDDLGDWAFGLTELSLAPHWMISLSDLYNVGETHLHYYKGSVTFAAKSHRVQLGYGRTKAGYNCSGGVCRYVPASKGWMLSYNYNF